MHLELPRWAAGGGAVGLEAGLGVLPAAWAWARRSASSAEATTNARLALCALALVLTEVSGCATSRYAPLQPTPEVLAHERPNEVLVTRNDGSTVTLCQPDVVGGTLRGFDRSPDRNGPVFLVVETPVDIPRRIRNIGSLGTPVFLITGVVAVWVGVCLASKEWCALGTR